MDKFKIWIIPGLVVILALIGLVYVRGKLPSATPGTAPIVSEESSKSGPKGFVKLPEPSEQKKAEADSLAMVAALNSGDLTACAKITWSEEMRMQCEDNVNYAVVVKSANPGQCEVLHNKELKIRCYDKIHMSMAVDGKDYELCEKIIDKELRQMCLDQVAMVLAHSAEKLEDCSKISTAVLKRQCEDNFYLKSSAKELSSAGCDNISDPLLAEQCRSTVSQNTKVMEQSKLAAASATTIRTPQEILVLCNGLNDVKSAMCKDAVYPQLAFDEKDLSYCQKISNPDKANECMVEQDARINTYYLRQAIASRNKSLCEEITDSELQTVCRSS